MKFKLWLISVILLFTFNINTVFASALAGKKIVIDPGHGGKDPGAVSGGVREKDINNSVARRLAEILKGHGAEVVFTRLPEDDVYLYLSERVDISNTENPDLFISIHNNANTITTVSGVETYYSLTRPNIYNDRYVEYLGNKYEYLREETLDNIDYVYILVDGKEVKVEKSKAKIVYSSTSWQAIESKRIAELIVNDLASLGFKNRGAKNGNLYVTKYTTSPSVLLELGFITNPEERQKLIDLVMQNNISKKIVNALLNYFEQYEANKQKAFGQIEDFSVLLSKDLLFIGQAVDIFINSKENIEQYNFKLEIKRLDEVVYLSDFSNNLQYNYTPDKEGEYEVILYVKNINSSNEYDELINKKFQVFKLPSIKSITINPEDNVVGNKLNINAEKQDGSILGCDYIFELYKDNVLITSNKTDRNVFEYTPNEVGDYKLIVKIKDRLSLNEFDNIGEASFTVKPNESATNGNQGTDNQNQQTNVKPSNSTGNLLTYRRTLKKGMNGEDVRELQKALIKLGYLKIKTPTNLFGPSTEAAVKVFQRANKLVADGVVGKATVNRINLLMPRVAANTLSRGTTSLNQNNSIQLKINRVLKKGMTGQDVRGLQTALIKLGYLKIKTPTTLFGSSTEAAVKSLQKANKLTADGIVGKSTVDKINSLLNKIK